MQGSKNDFIPSRLKQWLTLYRHATPRTAAYAARRRRLFFARARSRIKVNLVNVSFSVRDSRGALVENLTKDDFEVLEDAVPQKIAFFSRSSDVPLTLGLIVDASGSQDHFSKQHKHDLEVFLQDVLGPKDRAFMLCFGNHLRLVSDFTQSSAQILDGLNRYQHDGGHFPELGPKESRDLGTAF